MGDVLVRKSISIQQQPGQAPGVFIDPFAGRGKGVSVPLRNPAGLERTPRAAAAAKQAGTQAAANLARMPRTGSVDDPDARKKVALQRSRAQDQIDIGKPRSLEEKIGVQTFNRLQDNYGKHNPNLVDRAAARAGRVGVIGSRAGKAAGGLLGLLAGATALSDASASGQDFTAGLMGAGLTGATTYAQTAPTLARGGAKVGGRLGSASVIAPHNIRQGARNVSQAMDNIGQTLEAERQPVAVAQPTPTITRPMRPTAQQKTQSQQKATMGIYGQDPKGAPAQLGHFGPFADKHLQYQQEEAMNMIGVASPTSRNYNPTAYQDLQPKPPVHVVPGSGGQTTITGQPAPVAAPVNQPQVGVQSTLNVGEAASAFNKPPEGSVEAMKETGAAGKQAAADFMGTGSMASQSMAGNQPKPEEEEEEEEEQ